MSSSCTLSAMEPEGSRNQHRDRVPRRCSWSSTVEIRTTKIKQRRDTITWSDQSGCMGDHGLYRGYVRCFREVLVSAPSSTAKLLCNPTSRTTEAGRLSPCAPRPTWSFAPDTPLSRHRLCGRRHRLSSLSTKSSSSILVRVNQDWVKLRAAFHCTQNSAFALPRLSVPPSARLDVGQLQEDQVRRELSRVAAAGARYAGCVRAQSAQTVA